jgi:DNA-binding transcriptional LysR family regulator
MDYLKADFQKMDPKLFRSFMAATETKNFTLAAKKANMTQSGISQQIAKLEDQLGYPLFKRLGKMIILTETGENLTRYIQNYILSSDAFFDSIRGVHDKISGLVSFAMPPSCLFSVHFPLLLEKRKQHPEIELRVLLADPDSVLEMVLQSKVDFGFVTMNPKHLFLTYEKFCTEEYILVGSAKEEISDLTKDCVLEKKFIHYPGADFYYDFWLKYHFPEEDRLDHLSLVTSGNINSMEGAIKMVVGGLGYGVFPRHCVDRLLLEGKLVELRTEKPTPPNDIFIVKITDHRYPQRVESVIRWFYEMENNPSNH